MRISDWSSDVCSSDLLLTIFPQPYVARAKLLPQDNNSIGLGSTMNALGGQLQGFASLFGGAKQQTDMYLAVARSSEVGGEVIRKLKLVGPGGYASATRARDRKSTRLNSSH